MMSNTMTIQQSARLGQKTGLKDRILSIANGGGDSALYRMAWHSADDMAGALQMVGLDISVSTCKAYRNGSSEPRKTLGDAIAALAEITIETEIERKRDALRGLSRRRA